MFSKQVLKRFVKDYNLPIQILEDPYFSYFVQLYNKDFKVNEKLELLEKAIEECGSEDAFLETYYTIRDRVINTLKEIDSYKRYLEFNMNDYNVPQNNYPTKDVFKMTNIGKYFISIDLVKANYQALKYFDKDLVLGSNNYDEFLNNFTTLDYMKKSKYLRQVIFGNLNPKRQIKIERYIIQQILDYLLSKDLFKERDIRMVSADEIVIEVTDVKINSKAIEVEVKNKLNFEVDIEIYKLNNIGKMPYFVKEFINKEGYELKSIPLVYFAQAYKYYNNITLNNEDLMFFYENQVCQFLKPLDFDKGLKVEEDIEGDEII